MMRWAKVIKPFSQIAKKWNEPKKKTGKLSLTFNIVVSQIPISRDYLFVLPEKEKRRMLNNILINFGVDFTKSKGH
jgi:hypothetical protein